jgi:hypothetical protein
MQRGRKVGEALTSAINEESLVRMMLSGEASQAQESDWRAGEKQ